MSDIEDLIQYQELVIEEEKDKLHELNRISEYMERDMDGTDVYIDDSAQEMYRLTIETETLRNEVNHILSMSTVDTISTRSSGWRLTFICELEFKKHNVAMKLRTEEV